MAAVKRAGGPIWLLDIDGVVNALELAPARAAWPEAEFVETAARSAHNIEWPLLAAIPVLDFLRRVHAEGTAEIVWHSAWQEFSVNVAGALGLPDWPILDCPEIDEDEALVATPLRSGDRPWWKLPAAQRAAAGGRPLLWTDDDARRKLGWLDPPAWCRRALIIAPDEEVGLTPDDLRRIGEWLADG